MGNAPSQNRWLLALLFLGSAFNAVTALENSGQPLKVAAEAIPPLFEESHGAEIVFPGYHTFLFSSPPSSWAKAGEISFSVDLQSRTGQPTSVDSNVQVMVIVEDRDHFWYQNLMPHPLEPGGDNRFRVSLKPGERTWQAVGHQSSWNLRALLDPLKVGVRLFAKHSGTNSVRIHSAMAYPRDDDAPPDIRLVRTNADRVHCYEKFEVRFRLPDRYLRPFDSDEILVTADFEGPDGKTTRVDGFYARSYYREMLQTGDRSVPQGAPYWCVRFAPRVEGTYRYRIGVRDRFGSAEWGEATFQALPARRPGYIRVSERDPRHFEFSNGSFFYPLGHNVRSPFDSRMDRQFPLRQRWEQGASAYEHYFPTMSRNGENFSELWLSAWSLGLEWTDTHPGYHGIGDYNLEHAWELDRVLDLAERENIYINLVVHNHGKFSLHWDSEWGANPFNKACGGFLSKPEEFFSDPRAIKEFRRFMRYVIARWGYSTHIFAWQLWSELDLVGSQPGFSPTPEKFYKQPVVADWHRLMGRAIKDMDPFGHMVATHVCKDYTHQNSEIASMPEMDFCPIDAYYYTNDPLSIADLLRRTAAYNHQFRKPVLITEFGGSPEAHEIDHLRQSLHAGLWSSTAIPLGGAPMFWWWQLVDEENFYPMFAANERFMADVDRRDPTLAMTTPTIERAPAPLNTYCLQNQQRALGWIFHPGSFGRVDPENVETIAGAVLRLSDWGEGEYDVEFWDTRRGEAVTNISVEASDNSLRVEVPRFERDVAFKIEPSKKHTTAAADTANGE